MGNKQRSRLYRRKDPRTTKRRTYHNKKSSLSSITTTTTTTNNMVTGTGTASPTAGCSSSNTNNTASARKINSNLSATNEVVEVEEENDSDVDNDNSDDNKKDCYLLINTEILLSAFSELKCPRCTFNVEASHMVEERQGLANLIKITCRSISCQWTNTFYTSKTVEKDGRGLKPFEVNVRAIMAFREIG